MRKKTREVLRLIRLISRNIVGGFLIIVGVAGLFLPILQGWLLIFLGVSLVKFRGKVKLIHRFKNWSLIRPLATRYDRWKRKVASSARKKLRKL